MKNRRVQASLVEMGIKNDQRFFGCSFNFSPICVKDIFKAQHENFLNTYLGKKADLPLNRLQAHLQKSLGKFI